MPTSFSDLVSSPALLTTIDRTRRSASMLQRITAGTGKTAITYSIFYWRDKTPGRFFHFSITRAGRVLCASDTSFSDHEKAREGAYKLLCFCVREAKDRARFRVEEAEHVVVEGTREHRSFVDPSHSNLLPSPRERQAPQAPTPLALSEL